MNETVDENAKFTQTSLFSCKMRHFQNCQCRVYLRCTFLNAGFVGSTMDYLRMDGKRGHVTCGNRLAIEGQESFQKFASLQEELLLPSAQACWDPTRFRIA